MQNISDIICALSVLSTSLFVSHMVGRALCRGGIEIVEPNAYIDDSANAPRDDTCDKDDKDNVERCYFESEEPIHRRGAY